MINGIYKPWIKFNFHVNMKFSKFVYKIYNIPFEVMDSHILPQHLLLPPLNELDFLGKMENFKRTTNKLCFPAGRCRDYLFQREQGIIRLMPGLFHRE